MDPVVGATATVEQPQMDSQTAQTGGIETPKEAVSAPDTGTDGSKPVESNAGGVGTDEPITLSREAYNNLLNQFVAGGQAPPTPLPQENVQSQSQPLEPPAFFNLDEQTFNQALRDPQTFNQSMNQSMLGAISNALALYEKRNEERVENAVFNVLASKDLLAQYPLLQGRGDVVSTTLNQVRQMNPGLGRDALLEKTHEFIQKNLGLARKIESTQHDHIPKEKVPGAGPSARAKGGTATSRTNRSAQVGKVTELSRLGLA